jgi:hypothetical protein
MLIYTHCWELMNSLGSHGSLSLPFMMKVMVCHFVSDSLEVMTVTFNCCCGDFSATSSIYFLPSRAVLKDMLFDQATSPQPSVLDIIKSGEFTF